MAGLAYAVAAWRGAPLVLAGPAPGAELAGGVALGLVAVGGSWLARGLPVMAAMARELRRALGPLGMREVLGIAVASGVGEELLFRGALQPWIGLVATSALFAAMHPPVAPGLRPWPWLALGAGVLLGLLARETGGLLAPIGFHAALNAGNMTWIVSMEEPCDVEPPPSPC